MADRMMTGRQMRGLAAPIISAFCLMSSVGCFAEDLPDPTRPPANIFVPVGGAGNGAGSGAGARGEATEKQSSVGLRTIIISEKRRAAIIDGQTVELGGVHGDARLIEVNEGGVVLQRAQRKQVLALFPDVKLTRKETLDPAPAEKASPNSESQVKQPSPASRKRPGKHKAKPAAHKERK